MSKKNQMTAEEIEEYVQLQKAVAIINNIEYAINISYRLDGIYWHNSKASKKASSVVNKLLKISDEGLYELTEMIEDRLVKLENKLDDQRYADYDNED